MHTDDRQALLEQIGAAETVEAIGQCIVQHIASVMDAKICAWWRVYDDAGQKRLRLMAACGVKAPQTLAKDVSYAITPGAATFDGITGRVASTLSAVRVNSFAELRDRFPDDHAGKMDQIQWDGRPEEKFRNLLALPVHLGATVLGVLKVESRRDSDFTESDEDVLRSFVEIVALACKWMLVLDQQEQRNIDAPRRLTEALVHAHDPDKLTQEIVSTTAQILHAEICSLWTVETGVTGRILVHRASHGFRGTPEQVPRYSLPDEPEKVADTAINGITAWVAARRRVFWANNHETIRSHASWRGSWDNEQFGGKPQAAKRFRSLCAVPLLWRDEVLGVLKVENPLDKERFSETDRNKTQLMANLVALLLVISRQLRVSLLPEMAHILKSPVGAIVENLRALEHELAEPAPDEEYVKRFLDYAKKCAMTADVISRTLSAQMLYQMETQAQRPVDLAGLLRTWVGYAQDMVPGGMHVAFVTPVAPPIVPLTDVEKTWVEIVVFNLIHNAVKYTPANGEVTVTLDCQDGTGRILVEDRGPGLDEETARRLFEPGFKRTAPGWPAGTGLGLFTVKDRLDKLGWRCVPGNREQGGARFLIEIPPNWRGQDGQQETPSAAG
jgi:signal transduction histidine kinase